MATMTAVVKNGTPHKLRFKMWNSYYCTETQREVYYPSEEEEKTVEQGSFISFNAFELYQTLIEKQRLSISFEYRVYIGSSNNHSATLQVVELLINGGIILYVVADNELHKTFISRVELNNRLKQRRATNNSCLMWFLPLLCTEKQLTEEIREEMDTIMDDDSSSAARLTGGQDDSLVRIILPIQKSLCKIFLSSRSKVDVNNREGLVIGGLMGFLLLLLVLMSNM